MKGSYLHTEIHIDLPRVHNWLDRHIQDHNNLQIDYKD